MHIQNDGCIGLINLVAQICIVKFKIKNKYLKNYFGGLFYFIKMQFPDF